MASSGRVAAMDIATAAGGQVAFTASDTFCVERHRSEFQELVTDQVDILFANERELKALYANETARFEVQQ